MYYWRGCSYKNWLQLSAPSTSVCDSDVRFMYISQLMEINWIKARLKIARASFFFLVSFLFFIFVHQQQLRRPLAVLRGFELWFFLQIFGLSGWGLWFVCAGVVELGSIDWTAISTLDYLIYCLPRCPVLTLMPCHQLPEVGKKRNTKYN